MSVQHDDIGAAARSAPTVIGTRGEPYSGCRCALTALPSPVGNIVVLRIAGELDLSTVDLVQTTLSSALSARPDTLVVDISEVTFAGARGSGVLFEAAAVAVDRGTRYVISGASAQARRTWPLLWPADRIPEQFPSARMAVLAAMTRQTDRRDRLRPPAPSPLRLVPDPRPAPDTDRQLTERARAGDTEAYRALVQRHRTRMYSSVLHALGASDDPDDVADDIASRLHTALEAFGRATPP